MDDLLQKVNNFLNINSINDFWVVCDIQPWIKTKYTSLPLPDSYLAYFKDSTMYNDLDRIESMLINQMHMITKQSELLESIKQTLDEMSKKNERVPQLGDITDLEYLQNNKKKIDLINNQTDF